MTNDYDLLGKGYDFDREPGFLFDDELGEPNRTSEQYLEGVRDAQEGNFYNQHYLPSFDEHGNVMSVPQGGFDYDQGFKSVVLSSQSRFPR